jgi:hypothetical protein
LRYEEEDLGVPLMLGKWQTEVSLVDGKLMKWVGAGKRVEGKSCRRVEEEAYKLEANHAS